METGARAKQAQLYESIDVWERLSKTEAVHYRCFRNLKTNRYSVQSADFLGLPFDSARASNLEKQRLELFLEQLPDERSGSFQTIEEAIEAHDREFQ